MRRMHFWLGLCLSAICFADPHKIPRQFPSLAFPLLPRLVAIPESLLRDTIYPGIEQHAVVIQKIVSDLYGPQTLLNRYPHWKNILLGDPGFWPELVGKTGDPYFATFFGPDGWVLPSNGGVTSRIGEYNGSNVGGAEAIPFYLEMARRNPKVFGNNPYPKTRFWEGWAKNIKELAKAHFGSKRSGAIVYLTDATVAETVIRDGKDVESPWPLGEGLHVLQDELARFGIEFVSLVEPTDPNRVAIENDVVFLEEKKSGIKKRIDVLIQFLDVESIDPAHTPQRRRNIEANQEKYNHVADEIGIAGLVRAWVTKKEGGFIWIGGPTSNLKRSKIFPVLAAEYMSDLFRNNEILIPFQETVTFFDRDGTPNRSQIAKVRQQPDKWVLKYVLGGGGKEVFFGEDDPELFANVLAKVERNPFCAIAQPFVTLSRMDLPFEDGAVEARVFDLRSIHLVFGHDDSFQSHRAPIALTRVARQDSLRVNVSGGGGLTLLVPTSHPEIRLLPRWDGEVPDCKMLLLK